MWAFWKRKCPGKGDFCYARQPRFSLKIKQTHCRCLATDRPTEQTCRLIASFTLSLSHPLSLSPPFSPSLTNTQLPEEKREKNCIISLSCTKLALVDPERKKWVHMTSATIVNLLLCTMYQQIIVPKLRTSTIIWVTHRLARNLFVANVWRELYSEFNFQ